MITNNIFYGQNAGWNIQTAPGSHDYQILNNTMVGGANPNESGCLMLWGANTNVLIEDNIGATCGGYFAENYAFSPSNVVFNHDLTTEPEMIAVSGTSNVGDIFSSNPAFVSAGTVPDYHLTTASPAIGTGIVDGVTTDFDGVARTGTPSIGAYVAGGAAPPPPPPPPPSGFTSVSSLNFGTVTVGKSSAVQTVTLTNNSTKSVKITASALSPAAFAFGGTGTCNNGQSLAVGAHCTISVKFSPTAAGAQTGSLVITDTYAGSPQTVALIGSGK
jgi:hypothetical protein